MASRIVRCAWSSKPASVCLALWFAVGVTTQRAAAASDPQQVAQDFYAVLLSTMRDGRSLGQNGRYARLAPVVNRTFDLAFMARLAVGPSWATLAPSEQQRLTDAFGNYISATYADRFNTYSGEQLKVTDERPYGSAVMVETKIVKSNGEATTLTYLMRHNLGAWQISDVYLDGTISQLQCNVRSSTRFFGERGWMAWSWR
jgi:phospholipid transport system substrate-binding protein